MTSVVCSSSVTGQRAADPDVAWLTWPGTPDIGYPYMTIEQQGNGNADKIFDRPISLIMVTLLEPCESSVVVGITCSLDSKCLLTIAQ